MARPKLGEGETERLHVKISSEELTAIDDWRFTNRISSRSEAVRRLVQIAHVLEENFGELIKVLQSNSKAEKEYADAFSEWISSKPELELNKENPIDKRFITAFIKANLSRNASAVMLSSVLRPINVLRGADQEFAAALDAARETNNFFKEQSKVLEEVIRKGEE